MEGGRIWMSMIIMLQFSSEYNEKLLTDQKNQSGIQISTWGKPLKIYYGAESEVYQSRGQKTR